MSDEVSKEELLRINLELVKQNNRLSHDNQVHKLTIEEHKKINRDHVVSMQQIIRQGRAAQVKIFLCYLKVSKYSVKKPNSPGNAEARGGKC